MTLYRITLFTLSFLMLNLCLSINLHSQQIEWPEGKKMALSLSFDDARVSNPTLGVSLLDKYDVKATFFLVPSAVRKNLEGWKKAADSGHEMANHSLNHPCSGNFGWSGKPSLDEYTLTDMRKELEQANAEIYELLGVTPKVYAYPCGQTYLGRGANAQSFIPLIDEMFLAGRGWLGEAPVDPVLADMAHLTGMKMDNMDFDEILPIVEAASKSGKWLVLAGHETDDAGNQTTYLKALERLLQYAKDPANGIWIAPVGTVAEYVEEKREQIEDAINVSGTVRRQPDGQFRLTAERGQGIGPNIKYMPEWRAFGWYTAADRVEWEVEIIDAGQYDVFLEWSVSDDTAGNPFVFEGAEASIDGIIGKTGSWETFKEEKIGRITLEPGLTKMVFKGSSPDPTSGLLDLREIRLVPVK